MLSASEFAKRVGVSVSTITKQLRSGTLKGTKISGKWQIPESFLTAGTAKKSAAPIKSSSTAKTNAAKAISASLISVDAFCEMTYLTRQGILQWLKTGRLKGAQDAEGTWYVDPASLKLSHMQHLIRDPQ